MATNFYACTSITGGATGALDKIDESVLGTGDVGFVIDSNEYLTIFRYNADSSTSESSPWTTNKIVAPDNIGGSNGRWILSDMNVDSVVLYGSINITGSLDIDTNLSFDGSGTTVNAISSDVSNNGSTSLSTEAAIKSYVDNNVAGMTLDMMAGMVHRPVFTWSDADTITLNGFRYHHNGTSEQLLKNDTTLTFDFGSGGSNGNSSNLGTDEWQYLYIDDSAVVTDGSTTVTETELLNSSVVPTWDADQLGWYGPGTGNTETGDRCIGAFYVNSSGNLDEFWHCDDYIEWDTQYNVFSTLTSSYVAKTFRAPILATNQRVQAHIYADSNSNTVYYQHTAGSANNLVLSDRRDTSGDNQGRGSESIHRTFIIDSSQQANFKTDASRNCECFQTAYYLPRGM